MDATLRNLPSLESILDAMADLPEYLGLDRLDVNTKGGFGNTPLKIAAVWGDVDAIELLVAAGARIDERNEDGMTALHHAAAQNHPQAVKKLIALGASVDARDDDGRTPLDWAKSLGNHDVIEWLAKDGA
jgi:ankyrin repeat protein